MRILAICSLAALLSGCVLDLSSVTRTSPLRETVLQGDSGPKVALVEVHGVITSSQRRGGLGTRAPSLLAEVREALDRAAEDSAVEAVLLSVRSPGGAVDASETLHHELEVWKQETGNPIVAFLYGLAASGGYYIAMAADEVVAHPTAVTGSIGVVMSGVNVSGLMERFGVENQTMTSGPYKDAGSPLRPMKAAERAQLQGVVDSLYQRFVSVVDAGRPELDREAVVERADGRIFTADQALELGLVDSIGHMDAALKAVESRIGATSSRLVIYSRPNVYRDNFYARSGGAPAIQVVDVDLFDMGSLTLAPGFYYMWPAALPSTGVSLGP